MRFTNTFFTTATLLLNTHYLMSQPTFNWENATDNDSNITQTINGVTATFRVSSHTPMLISYGASGCRSGFFVSVSQLGENYASFEFSSPIDLISICAFDVNRINYYNFQTWTFTPKGSLDTSISAIIPMHGGATTINLNWTAITGFSVMSTNSNAAFGFDNLVGGPDMSIDDLKGLHMEVETYPNPAREYITISNQGEIRSYIIFDSTGSETSRGSIIDQTKISVCDFKPGLYFVKFDNGDVVKFMKQ